MRFRIEHGVIESELVVPDSSHSDSNSEVAIGAACPRNSFYGPYTLAFPPTTFSCSSLGVTGEIDVSKYRGMKVQLETDLLIMPGKEGIHPLTRGKPHPNVVPR